MFSAHLRFSYTEKKNVYVFYPSKKKKKRSVSADLFDASGARLGSPVTRRQRMRDALINHNCQTLLFLTTLCLRRRSYAW